MLTQCGLEIKIREVDFYLIIEFCFVLNSYLRIFFH